MSDEKRDIGRIGWIDLTVPDAEKIRDFYIKVVGWKSAPVSMGEYDDYCMIPPDENNPIAGICHALGVNKEIPPQWVIYITVENLDDSIASCKELGGEVIVGPKNMDKKSRYCIIKDPSGAVASLFEKM
ncbi:MAG: VOC family protein [bacterium]